MIQALEDQVELNSLIMTGNKKSWLAAARNRLNQGVASMAAAAGMNGTAAASTPAEPQPVDEDDTGGITNRSPRTSTIHNNYPPPPAIAGKSDAPWIALIVITLGMAGIGWYAMQPKQETTAPQTAPSQQPQGGAVKVPGGYNLGAQPYNPYQQ